MLRKGGFCYVMPAPRLHAAICVRARPGRLGVFHCHLERSAHNRQIPTGGRTDGRTDRQIDSQTDRQVYTWEMILVSKGTVPEVHRPHEHSRTLDDAWSISAHGGVRELSNRKLVTPDIILCEPAELDPQNGFAITPGGAWKQLWPAAAQYHGQRREALRTRECESTETFTTDSNECGSVAAAPRVAMRGGRAGGEYSSKVSLRDEACKERESDVGVDKMFES